MIELKDCQARIKELIEADDTWDSESVLIDDGKQQPNIEGAVNSSSAGRVALIGVPDSATVADQSKGVAVINVLFPVWIYSNPKKNTDKSIYDLLSAAKTAVTAGAPIIHPQDRFKFAGFKLVTFDPGLHAYSLVFSKT